MGWDYSIAYEFTVQCDYQRPHDCEILLQAELLFKELEHLINENSRALFTFYSVTQWVSLRLNFLSYVYIAVNIAIAILLKFWLDLDPALVGMSVTLTLEIGSLFAFLVR